MLCTNALINTQEQLVPEEDARLKTLPDTQDVELQREQFRLVIAIDYGTDYTGKPPTSATRHLVLTGFLKQVSRLLPLLETKPILTKSTFSALGILICSTMIRFQALFHTRARVSAGSNNGGLVLAPMLS